MRKLALLNKLSSLGQVISVGTALTPLIGARTLVPYPYTMSIVVTHRCNSRCRMCYLWREKESLHLSLEQFLSIFERNDFSFIRSVVLTGGETTLRADLPDLFKLILAHMPKLEHVQLATNGLNPERTIAYVIQMAEAWEGATVRSARFDVQISLDGLGEVHDMMRGIPGFFDHVCETLDQLQWLHSQFPWLVPRLSCVVTPYNLPHLEALHTFAEQRDLPIHYNPAVISDAYYANSETNLSSDN